MWAELGNEATMYNVLHVLARNLLLSVLQELITH